MGPTCQVHLVLFKRILSPWIMQLDDLEVVMALSIGILPLIYKTCFPASKMHFDTSQNRRAQWSEELISFWLGVHISGICVHPQEQDFSFHTQLISLLPPFFRHSLYISPNFAHFPKVYHDEDEDYGPVKYYL